MARKHSFETKVPESKRYPNNIPFVEEDKARPLNYPAGVNFAIPQPATSRFNEFKPQIQTGKKGE